MERTIEIDTGESVVIVYELAGLGSRFLAVLVDFVVQIASTLALGVVLVLMAMLPAWRAVYYHGQTSQTPYIILGACVLLVQFLIHFGYFIVFEWRWNGRTPGKRLLGIRAMRDGGFPLDFTTSVIRNLVRIPESLLGFYAISALSTLLSSQNKRLGDFAAGTIVVRDRALDSPALFQRTRPA